MGWVSYSEDNEENKHDHSNAKDDSLSFIASLPSPAIESQTYQSLTKELARTKKRVKREQEKYKDLELRYAHLERRYKNATKELENSRKTITGLQNEKCSLLKELASVRKTLRQIRCSHLKPPSSLKRKSRS